MVSHERTEPTEPPTDAERFAASVRGKTNARGLVIVNTGEGKGKTTAAFGIAMRASGRGIRVGVIQYIKPETANYGARRAARRLGIRVAGSGDGWTWSSKDLDGSASLAQHGWEMAKAWMAEGELDVLVLDEFTYPLIYGWVELEAVIGWLRDQKPEMLHVVITGRDAPPALIAFADLVTEMRVVKHPFEEQGVRA